MAPPAATEGADRPLHRVRNSHATPEDVAACSHTVLGAAASAPLKAGSIVASAAEARGLTLISNAKQDPRYHEASDRLPGLPPAQRTLLLNLSDEQGDVRAVLRCARPFTARHGTAGGWSGREAALAELGPLFTLTLRCCFASSSPQVHHQHRQHRYNHCYYYQCYHYCYYYYHALPPPDVAHAKKGATHHAQAHENAHVAAMVAPLCHTLALNFDQGRQLDKLVATWSDYCRELVRRN